jgi:hypothetical protein
LISSVNNSYLKGTQLHGVTRPTKYAEFLDKLSK